jgi:hypothetical protein
VYEPFLFVQHFGTPDVVYEPFLFVVYDGLRHLVGDASGNVRVIFSPMLEKYLGQVAINMFNQLVIWILVLDYTVQYLL